MKSPIDETKLNQLIADIMAVRYLLLSIYAQSDNKNEIMRHFLKSSDEAHTHNTFSGLPESFVLAFDETRRDIVTQMQLVEPISQTKNE